MLADALEHLVRGIVDNPDDVRVQLVTTRRGRTLEVHVHPDDLGTVIGRGGPTATALRTVRGGIGRRGAAADVVETERAARWPGHGTWPGGRTAAGGVPARAPGGLA